MRVLTWLLFLVPIFAFGLEDIVWKGDTTVMEIAEQVHLLEDKTGDLDISRVSSPEMAAAFTRPKHTILRFDFNNSVHWLKFSLQNNTRDTLLLVLAQAVLPAADLYFKNDSGQWQCLKAGYKINFDNKPVPHHFQIYPLLGDSRE